MKNTEKFQVGVLREEMADEARVALIPSDIARLASKVDVQVEFGAGEAAGYSDVEYIGAGAHVGRRDEVISRALALVSVQPPDLANLKRGQVLVSLGRHNVQLREIARISGIIHLGLERLPRTTRAQSMDVLSSQASVAGYAAVIEGARLLNILMPMMTSAAGTIRPAKMMALGAGVAGLQALATARRLGAITFGFDVREAAREQVESLGAKFVFPEVRLEAAEGNGGYAAAQSEDQQSRLRLALLEHLVPMNLIITSAQIPGHRAPLLIDERALASLNPGTVVVDMAAESGGNVALTRPGEVVRSNGVLIYGPTNLPSTVASDSSRLFSGNIRALLDHLLIDGTLDLTRDDAIVRALVADQFSAAKSDA